MRSYGFIVLALISLSCISDAEKVPLPPLPVDGAPLSYNEVLARLVAQTNSARDEHFLNHWDRLAEIALALEQSAIYLPKSTNVPPSRQATLAQDSASLIQNIRLLQTTARLREETKALEAIRRIHNQIRELKAPAE